MPTARSSIIATRSPHGIFGLRGGPEVARSSWPKSAFAPRVRRGEVAMRGRRGWRRLYLDLGVLEIGEGSEIAGSMESRYCS